MEIIREIKSYKYFYRVNKEKKCETSKERKEEAESKQ